MTTKLSKNILQNSKSNNEFEKKNTLLIEDKSNLNSEVITELFTTNWQTVTTLNPSISSGSQKGELHPVSSIVSLVTDEINIPDTVLENAYIQVKVLPIQGAELVDSISSTITRYTSQDYYRVYYNNELLYRSIYPPTLISYGEVADNLFYKYSIKWFTGSQILPGESELTGLYFVSAYIKVEVEGGDIYYDMIEFESISSSGITGYGFRYDISTSTTEKVLLTVPIANVHSIVLTDGISLYTYETPFTGILFNNYTLSNYNRICLDSTCTFPMIIEGNKAIYPTYLTYSKYFIENGKQFDYYLNHQDDENDFLLTYQFAYNKASRPSSYYFIKTRNNYYKLYLITGFNYLVPAREVVPDAYSINFIHSIQGFNYNFYDISEEEDTYEYDEYLPSTMNVPVNISVYVKQKPIQEFSKRTKQ
jgi:hypothetical protein